MEQTLAYSIKIQNFEGPLDLLFHLIEKNKMDIYDIQITDIADQYMEYLNTMEELDLEIASEFLVMASTLLLLKSKLLLPEANRLGEDQEDLKDDLVSRLLEYKRYKEFTVALKDREASYSHIFYKPHEILKILPEKIVNKIYNADLIPAIYKEICERNIRRINPTITNIEELLIREKITIRSKIKEVVKTLIDRTKFIFSELFDINKNSKLEVAIGFMAVLELAKVKRVKLEQKKPFGEITVKKLDHIPKGEN